MRFRSALLTVATALLPLLFGSASHAAAGLNLSWTDCGTFGQLQRSFACDTNAGSHELVGSAVAGQDMPELESEASVVDMVVSDATLSPWWHLELNGCRRGTMTASFDFTAMSSCMDPWTGQAQGGVDFSLGPYGANRARIRTVAAIPGSTSITGTDEYYLFRVMIRNEKTVGTGSCAGCSQGACLVLTQLELYQPEGVGNVFIRERALDRMYVLWQQGGENVAGGCPGATPARSRTWGSLKSMYR